MSRLAGLCSNACWTSGLLWSPTFGSTDDDSKSNDDPNDLFKHTGIHVSKALVLCTFSACLQWHLNGFEHTKSRAETIIPCYKTRPWSKSCDALISWLFRHEKEQWSMSFQAFCTKQHLACARFRRRRNWKVKDVLSSSLKQGSWYFVYEKSIRDLIKAWT